LTHSGQYANFNLLRERDIHLMVTVAGTPFRTFQVDLMGKSKK